MQLSRLTAEQDIARLTALTVRTPAQTTYLEHLQAAVAANSSEWVTVDLLLELRAHLDTLRAAGTASFTDE